MVTIPGKVAGPSAVSLALAAFLLLLGAAVSLHAQEGTLQSIRNDVREGPPPSQSSSSPQSSTPQSSSNGSDNSGLDDDPKTLFLAGVIVVGGAVTAPFGTAGDLQR